MKATFVVSLLALSALIPAIGHAQGTFQNLDFEDAVIILDTSSPYYPRAVYASYAILGWTATGFVGPQDIYYNSLTIGSPCVSIDDTTGSFHAPPIDGTYSIVLYGGSGSASISQTGLVPADAASIRFIAQVAAPPPFGGPLLVSLGGQNILYSAISTGPNYTVYGGNIPSGLAGQSEQLMFSALTGVNNIWTIDDIQFSPSAVPEPSTLGLLALGALAIAWRSRNNPVCDLRLYP